MINEFEDTLLNARTDLDSVISVIGNIVPVERMQDKETVLESLKGISKKLWDIYEVVFLANIAKEDK